MPDALSELTRTNVCSRRSWNVGGRALLILVLVVLVGATWALNTVMPPANLEAQFNGRLPLVYWYSGPAGQQRDYSKDPYEIYEDPISVMSVDTGEITSATRAAVFWRNGVNRKGERVEIVVPSTQQLPVGATKQLDVSRVHVYFKNMETGVSRHVEFDMPGTSHELVNNRYAVSRDPTQIYAVDLEDATPQVFSIASARTGTDQSVNAIYGTELLYEVQPPKQPNATRHKLELFKIADHQIQLVKTLEIGCFVGSLGGYTRYGRQLLTLSVDGKSVAFHSLDSLELVNTVEISEQILAEYDVDFIEGELLHGVNKVTGDGAYFHVLTQQPINLPPNTTEIAWSSAPDDRYWCFRNGVKTQSLFVYDMQEHRVCLQLPDSQHLSFLEDGRFAVVYPSFGVTTIVYDLQTGKSIRQAPYQWCAVALAATMLAWFGWCIAWLVISARAGSWALLDLAMLFVFVPGILAYIGVGSVLPGSPSLWGQSPNSVSFVVGISLGLLCLSAIWSGLRRPTRSIDMLPMILIFAALLYWLNATPSGTRSRPMYLSFAVLAFEHAAGILVVSVILRKSKSWSLTQGEVPSVSKDQPYRVTLHDLFAYIACSAVIVAATKPYFQSLSFFHVSYFLSPKLMATPICFVAALGVLSRSQNAVRLGCAAAVLAWLLWVAFELWLFSGYRRDLSLNFDRSAVRTVIMALTSTVICAIAFRLRSYRILRA